MHTLWVYSAAMLVPASHQEKANKLAQGLGYGPNNFSVPLSPSGELPATHYACFTLAQKDFVNLISATKAGFAPSVPGMTESEVRSVLAVMKSEIKESSIIPTHFESIAAANNLKAINLLANQVEHDGDPDFIPFNNV